MSPALGVVPEGAPASRLLKVVEVLEADYLHGDVVHRQAFDGLRRHSLDHAPATRCDLDVAESHVADRARLGVRAPTFEVDVDRPLVVLVDDVALRFDGDIGEQDVLHRSPSFW